MIRLLLCLCFISSYTSTARLSASLPTRGVSFSPAGLLTPFHLGVAQTLKDAGVIDQQTVLSGASGGALASVLTALDTPKLESLEACKNIAVKCRDLGTFKTLRQSLDEELDIIITAEAVDKINDRPGKVAIAYLDVLPRIKSNLVSAFEDAEHLKQTLRASCCIPIYFSGFPAVRVNQKRSTSYAVDGFFAVNRSRFGCPATGAKIEIIVCPFDPLTVGLKPTCKNTITKIIAPNNVNWSNTKDMLALALAPPTGRSLGQVNNSRSLATDSEIYDVYNGLYESGEACANEFLRKEWPSLLSC